MATQDFAQFDSAVIDKFLSRLTNRNVMVSERSQQYVGIISALVFQETMRHFRTEMGPDGPWEPWSVAYAIHMAKVGKAGNNLLQDSGGMRQRMMPVQSGKAVRKSKAGIIWYNDAKSESGFPIAYAHDNDKDSRGQLPQRSFMWLSDKGLDKISDQTLRFLLGEK